MNDWPPPQPHDHAAVVILEILMTQHWDMKACECWVCVEGRAAGCRPRGIYLPTQRPRVSVAS